jgi:TrmH family RNA methyltransferase
LFDVSIISRLDLKKISNLSNPKDSLAIFQIPIIKKVDTSNLIVSLDCVNDPGNLGTIIRLCDWFGVKDIVCSKDTVDCYNPKVVQASMGSLSRVNISYLDLNKFLKKVNVPIYGTFMQGESIFNQDLINEGVFLFGNEANGISKEILKYIDKKISIPRFGKLKKTESLNVANAAAIILAENSRKTIEK